MGDAGRQTDRVTDRQTDRQTDRPTDRCASLTHVSALPTGCVDSRLVDKVVKLLSDKLRWSNINSIPDPDKAVAKRQKKLAETFQEHTGPWVAHSLSLSLSLS